MQVKICGITNPDDALSSVEAGADALGFVFYPQSPRFIEPAAAAAIIRRLPPFVATVGVFVDASSDAVRSALEACGLSLIQFHGNETPDQVAPFGPRAIKAIRVGESGNAALLSRFPVRAFLLDTYVEGVPGGTGKAFDWRLANREVIPGALILAGGLTAENVRVAIRLVRPDAVDVGSGVEAKPGKKDHRKLTRFIREAKTEEPEPKA